MKKLISALLCAIVLVLPLSGCGNSDDTSSADKSSKSSSDTAEITLNESTDAYSGEQLGFQLSEPQEGEEVAVLHTNMGDIYMRFFEKAAPKAVENFKTHIKDGYYNGLIFHRVIKDFMIQGGDPNGTGTGGESIWGENFEDEFDKKLVNITGSVAMANSGVNTNGSQFFINCPSDPKSEYSSWEEMKKYYLATVENTKAQFKQYYGQSSTEKQLESMFNDYMYNQNGSPVYSEIPDEMWQFYYENGANLHLDGAYRATGGHTVFAQVYKGMDVVKAISQVDADESTNKPATDVVITSAELIKYSK